MAGGLCACAQTPALRGECRCARRSARRKRCAGSVTPGTPRRSPRRVLAEQRRGCATQATQTGATCPDGWRRPREAAGPPPYGGPAATEHIRGDRHRPPGFAKGWRSHRRSRLRPCKDWWTVLRLARAQPPPLAAVWIEGGAWRRPRAPPLWSERSERNRRGAQPPRAGRGRPAGRGGAGCCLAAGGTHPFCRDSPASPVRALHRAPCRGEKKRGPALAGWPSLKCGRSRVPPSSVHPYCITTNRCCQGLRCSFLDAE